MAVTVQISDIVLPLSGPLLSYVLFRLVRFLYSELTAPLRVRDLPGPKSPSFWYGSFNELSADMWLMDKWRAKYGRNFHFRSLFNVSELHTSDPKAMAHIVANTVTYQKSPTSRSLIARMVGNGILAVELDDHKYQASLLQIPVRPLLILRPEKDYGESSWLVNLLHANEVCDAFIDDNGLTTFPKLRDYWIAELAKSNDEARIEVFSWLRRTALDVIGETGFNYKFDSLNPNGKPSELMEAMTQLFHSSGSQQNFVLRYAQAYFPFLRFIPLPNRDAKMFFDAQRRLFEIGANLVAESKAYIEAAGGEKNAGSRQDLLSLLMRANLATDLPENERLTDAAVIARECIDHVLTDVSIMEQKALLFSLVRTFEFEKALPKGAIGRTSSTALQKPIVLAEREKGSDAADRKAVSRIGSLDVL
ncbi:cytochrome P450 [Mycena galopus ATCC 62051]|nr:cytochrome P450 [Mycena galopus ATCC 62051]